VPKAGNFPDSDPLIMPFRFSCLDGNWELEMRVSMEKFRNSGTS